MSSEFVTITTAILAAFGTAAFTLWGAAFLLAKGFTRSSKARLSDVPDAQIIFLFDEERLIDATPAAQKLLESTTVVGSDWSRLANLLRFRFPNLENSICRLAETKRVEVPSADASGEKIVADWQNGVARIMISDGASVAETAQADHHVQAAIEAELETLRMIVRSAPVAVWKQGADGTITWVNEVYFSLLEDVCGPEEAHCWPPKVLFPIAGVGDGGIISPFRATLHPADGRPQRWYECQGYTIGDEFLCFATQADGVVRAEEALREFVQTLSKTFADLPIGLAVFDKSRKLALFNPALTDLTALDIGFLSSRPTLFAFLDQLREKRRIPEQRDYRSWRQRMSDLEASAASGFVQENWTLPTGQTLRVTGRPHPDGAVAFLFEDISAEISLTRRFRSEIELGQTVIDSIEEGIAVFSPAGTLSFSNAAYAALWGADPASTLAEIGIADATRQWQGATEPSPIWADLREFLSKRSDRADWTATVRLKNGPELLCRFQPLSGGATLVGFTENVTPPQGRAKAEPNRQATA